MSIAIELIIEERKRQIEVEGWTKEHDIEVHEDGDLSLAAACYAAHPIELYTKNEYERSISYEKLIPFDEYEIDNKKTELRKLVIAGALIVAEIERFHANEQLTLNTNP